MKVWKHFFAMVYSFIRKIPIASPLIASESAIFKQGDWRAAWSGVSLNGKYNICFRGVPSNGSRNAGDIYHNQHWQKAKAKSFVF